MPPCFSVVNLREIGGRKEAQAGKTSRSERSRRRHLDDGSFVRLPPVKIVAHNIWFQSRSSNELKLLNYYLGTLP